MNRFLHSLRSTLNPKSLTSRIQVPDLRAPLERIQGALPVRREIVFRRSLFGSLLAGAIGLTVGLVVGYFFDVQNGRGRRIKTRDQLMGFFRKGYRRLARVERHAVSDIGGMRARVTHMRPATIPPNDQALANKVMSELFRDPKIPKGRININAEHGVVVIRGAVENMRQVSLIEDRIRSIPGVVDVNNLLHLPQEEAPNKAEARHAQ